MAHRTIPPKHLEKFPLEYQQKVRDLEASLLDLERETGFSKSQLSNRQKQIKRLEEQLECLYYRRVDQEEVKITKSRTKMTRFGGHYYGIWGEMHPCWVTINPYLFYSLWFSYSPVFKVEEHYKVHIKTTSKDRPFRLSGGLDAGFRIRHLGIAGIVYNLKKGDFCDRYGHKLAGRNLDYATKIFGQVESGIEIFPRPEEPQGYIIKEKIAEEGDISEGGGTKSQVKRTAEQDFLLKLCPRKTILGELFGSGGSYCAYFFGDKVVVEADEPERATYLLNSTEFESVIAMNRSEVLRTMPEGFRGRIIHCGDTEQWQKRVNHFLR